MIQVFGRDPQHLGGDLGSTALLHTWGQTLSRHLHLHCVVTGGALTRDGARFIAAKPSFLFPVREGPTLITRESPPGESAVCTLLLWGERVNP